MTNTVVRRIGKDGLTWLVTRNPEVASATWLNSHLPPGLMYFTLRTNEVVDSEAAWEREIESEFVDVLGVSECDSMGTPDTMLRDFVSGQGFVEIVIHVRVEDFEFFACYRDNLVENELLLLWQIEPDLVQNGAGWPYILSQDGLWEPIAK